MLIAKIFRYSILGLIIFLILHQSIKLSFGSTFKTMGININGKNIMISGLVTGIILCILYMSDYHTLGARAKYASRKEHFEDLVDELVAMDDSIGDLDTDLVDDDEDDEDLDIEDTDIETNRGLNDVEIDGITTRTTVSDLGQEEPIQRKNLGGDKEDLEMQEIERLKRENDEIKERLMKTENALLNKLEQKGVLSDADELIKEYEIGVDKLKNEKPKSPFLLLDSSTLNTQRRQTNPGCRLPRVDITNDYYDITKIY